MLLPFAVFSQNDHLARLSIYGAVSEIGVSPSEEIHIATRAGNVYYTKKIGDLWNTYSPDSSVRVGNISSGRLFERINFFSEDTLMISGFIRDDQKEDFVYLSTNHGKTWAKSKFGRSSWIDAAYIKNNKAWMSGSSQLVYYTENRGQTWKEFDTFNKTGNLRISSICFSKDDKVGLFGSFWNLIYRTKDNCQSWDKIPTPLSQKKYERISKAARPDIRKIRIFGQFYILNQQGKVFITKSSYIDWQYLPKILDFEVSESEKLYTINKDLTIELYDSSFSSTWKSKEKIDQYPKAITSKNDNLFVLTYENIYKIFPNNFEVSGLFTDENTINEPYMKTFYNGEEFGFENRDVLKFDKKNKQWYRLMTLDFPVGAVTTFQNRSIITDISFRDHYYIDYNSKQVDKFELPKQLFSISTNKVIAFHIEKGSQGCFHSNNRIKSYSRKNSVFIVQNKTSTTDFLTQMEPEINEDIVNQLVNIIDSSKFSLVSISDFNINENDISKYKSFIDIESQRIQKTGINNFDEENFYTFPGENADFNFYKSIADTLFSIPSQIIDNAISQTNINMSTTTNWNRIIFVFQNGQKLIIENSDTKPNYLCTPWVVNYEGLIFTSNSIKFGQIIDKLTNGVLFNTTISSKNYAIFKIADYLYRQKIKEKY